AMIYALRLVDRVMNTLAIIFLYFEHDTHPRNLPSFPTRRSSDLYVTSPDGSHHVICQGEQRFRVAEFLEGYPFFVAKNSATRKRSEEHTSELQSPYELVCRLLLEKKKTRIFHSSSHCIGSPSIPP